MGPWCSTSVGDGGCRSSSERAPGTLVPGCWVPCEHRPPPPLTVFGRSRSRECLKRRGGRRSKGCLRWRPDHNSSRPLAVLLTLDRPSRNPESVILQAESKEVVQELRGAKSHPRSSPRPPRASRPRPDPTHLCFETGSLLSSPLPRPTHSAPPHPPQSLLAPPQAPPLAAKAPPTPALGLTLALSACPPHPLGVAAGTGYPLRVGTCSP